MGTLRAKQSIFVWAGLIAAMSAAALSQDYPSKPVRLIVPATTGGSTDFLTRLLGQKLNERWHQPVIIENRPGAGGMVAVEFVARSPSDGYTFVMVNAGFAIASVLFKNLQFDPVKDVLPVRQVASQPMIMVVHPSLGVRSVKELIVLAKNKPDQITFGSNGNGSISHLVGELFKSKTSVRMLHVPYKGFAQSGTALLSGEIEVLFPAVMEMVSHIKAGRLRALAVSTARRSPALPEVPAMIEAGVSNFDESNWQGLLAPAGTSNSILNRLSADLAAVLEASDVKARMDAQGADAAVSDPARFGTFVRTEMSKWQKLVSESGARID